MECDVRDFRAPTSAHPDSSNLRPVLASNFVVSTCGKGRTFAMLAGCLSVALAMSAALPLQAWAKQEKPSPVRTASADDATHTFDRYGPQATARAVRASLKVALVPDPLCMGSLLFCAFSLRWLRMRKERTQPASSPSSTALPGAA